MTKFDAKDPCKPKYQLLINKPKSVGFKHCNNSKASTEYSNDMDDIYKYIDKYNPNKEHKILIVSDDMIADMIWYKKFNIIVIELFIRGRKLNISVVFITKSCFDVPKKIKINSTHCFIVKIPSKKER